MLDAGCGTGRVTQLLLQRLPRGRVIAVDASPSMVAKAEERLAGSAKVVWADVQELVLDDPVDIVFSNAVFHWIPDHPRLFSTLHRCLRPGGRLAAQCGGEGNVASLTVAIRDAGTRAPFAEHHADIERPWTFRSTADATRDLVRAGFEDVECWLEPKPVTPADPRAYVATSALGFHLERLPPELREPFVDAVMEGLPEPVTLDYVRLNIAGRRPE